MSNLFTCPLCGVEFSWYGNSGYQVNDNFNLIFCSYDCSDKYTEQRKDELLKQGLTEQEIDEGV